MNSIRQDKTYSPAVAANPPAMRAVRPSASFGTDCWFVGLLISLCAATAMVDGAMPGETAETVWFAFDDHGIPWRDNLHLTLEQARKHPANPVLRRGPEGSPDHGHAILYGTVLRDGERFRMWYLGMPDNSFDKWRETRWRPMCYAESRDGISWVKPQLGLVEMHGSTANNACLIESDEHFLTRVDDFLSVIHEPDDPDPRRRYKCVFIAHMPWKSVRGGIREVGETPANLDKTRARLAMMVTAVSPDGLRWKVVGDRPAVNEKLEVSALYRFGSFYYAAGQQVSPWSWRADGSRTGRMMSLYRSPDFTHWLSAKATAFIRPGQRDKRPVAGTQTHMGAGIWNRGNVLVGLYGMWQDGPAKRPAGAARLWGTHIDLGLVVSSDGIHFREPVAGHKLIARGKPGDWDDTALLQGHAFANAGDRTMIWYSHWDTSGQLRNMEIGLATLRRDGFGFLSLHDKAAPGHCETALLPPRMTPRELLVNVDGVSSDRPLQVELLDELARPLSGYSGRDAALVSEGSLAARVVWPKSGRATLPANLRCAVRIRFPAGAASKLYCLYDREVQP